SEERRVGKECRSRGWADDLRKKLKGFVGGVVGGWRLSIIVVLQSAFPFSPQLGYDPRGSGDMRNPVRPYINPNCHGNLYPRTQQKSYLTAASLAPAYGTDGNLGRDTLTGPGLANVELALAKVTQSSERQSVYFFKQKTAYEIET